MATVDSVEFDPLRRGSDTQHWVITLLSEIQFIGQWPARVGQVEQTPTGSTCLYGQASFACVSTRISESEVAIDTTFTSVACKALLK